MSGPRIVSERLVQRHLAADDAPFILELLNEPAFLAHIGDRQVRDEEGARRYIARAPVASYELHGFGPYRVGLRDPRETPVGICGLISRPELDAPDLGFAFLAAHRRRGYAEEASRAVLQHARTELGLDRVTAIVNPDNAASIALLRKLGFSYERDLRLPGEPHAVRLFGRILT